MVDIVVGHSLIVQSVNDKMKRYTEQLMSGNNRQGQLTLLELVFVLFTLAAKTKLRVESAKHVVINFAI